MHCGLAPRSFTKEKIIAIIKKNIIMKSKIHEYLLKLNNIIMNKPFRIITLRTLGYISLGLLLLTTACGQTSSKSKTEVTTSTETKSVVDAPEMDIQTAILSDNLEAVKQHISAGTESLPQALESIKLRKPLLMPVRIYRLKITMVQQLCIRPHSFVESKSYRRSLMPKPINPLKTILVWHQGKVLWGHLQK